MNWTKKNNGDEGNYKKMNRKDLLEYIKDEIEEHIQIAELLLNDKGLQFKILQASLVMVESIKSGGTIFFCGNGGSAADAQHLAAELVGRFMLERRPLPAEALTVNTSVLTAIANDYSYDKVFSRQLQAKGKKGDILFAISTSGQSKNVLEAIKTAKKMGIKSIVLCGNNKETPLSLLSDYSIHIPSSKTPRIQELHIMAGHIICDEIERMMFSYGD